MRAVVQDRYGPPEVLHIEEVERPVPAAGEVLIHVRASTVSQTDTHIRRPSPWVWRLFAGLRRPRWRTLGVDFAGVIEAVGPGVAEFAPGDEVFGLVRLFGAHAEYIRLPVRGSIAKKPANLSFEEAAAVGDGAMQALATLRRGEVGEGSRIVVYGASGSLGPRPSRSRSTSVRTSRASRARRTSNSCARSAPTRSSTTRGRT